MDSKISTVQESCIAILQLMPFLQAMIYVIMLDLIFHLNFIPSKINSKLKHGSPLIPFETQHL